MCGRGGTQTIMEQSQTMVAQQLECIKGLLLNGSHSKSVAYQFSWSHECQCVHVLGCRITMPPPKCGAELERWPAQWPVDMLNWGGNLVLI